MRADCEFDAIHACAWDYIGAGRTQVKQIEKVIRSIQIHMHD